jgi:hypothetical protein
MALDGYDKKYIQQSNPYKKETNKENPVRNIYYGEVISIDDPNQGGRIRVKIPDFDNKTGNDQLPFAYPILPKFFWIIPQVGEVVRVFIEDVRYPQRGRHWMGSIISQPQKIAYDGYFTALSTSNVATINTEANPDSYPDAIGVFPDVQDVALLGRKNTDVLLKDKQIQIRVGKHKIDNILSLNKENPAFIQMDFIQVDKNTTQSSVVTMANKIAFITHEGDPKLKAYDLSATDLQSVFNKTHPLGRADLIVEAFEVMRNAMLQHIHGYSGIVADKNAAINQLEKVDFTKIMQQNIRIN